MLPLLPFEPDTLNSTLQLQDTIVPIRYLSIDNSFLENLITCPRSAEYSFLHKRIWAGDKPALNFGSAIHAALEYRYKILKNEPPTLFDNQDIYDKVLLPYFEANPQPEDDVRTLSFAHEVICEYNRRYQCEPFSLLLNAQGEVQCERTFQVPLMVIKVPTEFQAYLKCQEIHILYTGRIDLIVSWDGQIIIIDHKTSSQLGTTKADEYRVGPQFEGYAWALEKATNVKVSGFCVNAIRSKGKPGKPKNGWDCWWDETFQRYKEYFRIGQLKEWEFNTCHLIEEFFWHYFRSYMPQKKKACVLYGRCSYYDVCYLDPSKREQLLNSDQFTTNNWSPLKS